MTLMWPDRRGRTLLRGAERCEEGDVWRSWMRGEKRSETDEGRGGLLGGKGWRGGPRSPARLLRAQGKSGINVD